MPSSLYQLNLQNKFGGGEVYTQFMCQSLNDLNIDYKLVVSEDAEFSVGGGIISNK